MQQADTSLENGQVKYRAYFINTAIYAKWQPEVDNILTNKGVDYSMINTVFTSRDPNSFILRSITPSTDNNKKGVNNQKTDRYIQW